MKIWRLLISLALILINSFALVQAQDETTNAYEVKWSPDGRWIAVATSHGLWLFDAEDFQAEARIYFEEDPIGTVEFDTTGAYLAVSQGSATGLDDEAHFVRIVELETGEVIQELYPESYDENGNSVIYDMLYSRNGQYLLVANMGILSIYDATTFEQVKTVFMNTDETGMGSSEYRYWITSISEVGASGRFSVTNWNKDLSIISLNNEGNLRSHGEYMLPSDFVFSATYFESTSFFILAGDGVYTFDIADESIALAVQPSAEESTSGYALTTDEESLAIGFEGYWQLYDIENREMLLEVQIEQDADEFPQLFSLSFNSDSSRLVTLETGGRLTIWDTTSGAVSHSLWEFDRAFSNKWG